MILRQWYRAVRLKLQTWFKYRLVSVGKGVVIGKGTSIRPGAVEIGDYTFIGPDCSLSAGRITIGSYVMLTADVAIVGGDHRIDVAGVPGIGTGRDQRKAVVIADDAWIGRGAIIVHGVTIGKAAIVAAGALVTKDVEPYSIVGSPPARKIRDRFATEEQVEQHRTMLVHLRETGADYSAGASRMNQATPVSVADRP